MKNDPLRDTRPFHFATGATTLIHRLGRPLRSMHKKYSHAEIHVTVANTEDVVAGLVERRFDLGLISLPIAEPSLTVVPLFEEELLFLRPSAHRVRGNAVVSFQPSKLTTLGEAPFLLYSKKSNMRAIIDRFFGEIGLNPRVVMEADDTEAIKRLVEAGFGYSILPQFALRGPARFYQTFRIAGHRLARTQALAMARTDYPRALTQSIAGFLKTALVSG
ncbi:MAG: LysR family transcriptional regulator substrate-binding protein [Acidobacteriota bacterium]|nr:LysR family transcriptional regulator substrate-binding protein [Acidobacteriota bacterium]